MFSQVCVCSTFRGGYSIPSLGRGGTPPQVWPGGYPIPGLARGYPGYPPGPGMGYPQPDLGWGTPQTWDGVPPWTWDRYPLDLRWGTSQTCDGIIPPRPEMVRWGTPPRQISIASTCYVVGSMPLAFMQEDFLVQ